MNLIKHSHNQISSYYHKRLGSPTYLSAIIPFGTIHETIDNFGISHITEHLICRETFKFNNYYKLKSEIAKRGLYVNAHTSMAHTRVHIGVPMNDDFDFAMSLLSEMLYFPKYSDETLEIEKKSIESEISLLENNSKRFVYNELYRKTLGLKNGYIPNYGKRNRLQKFTINDVKNHFDYLRTLPITILGAGGVGASNFHEGSAGIVKFKSSTVDTPVALRSISMADNIEIDNGDRVTVGYIFITRISDIKTLCAFDIISEYIGNYMFGTITQKLRDESGDSYYVDSSHSVYGREGYLMICTDIVKKQREKLDDVVFSQVGGLVDGKIDTNRFEIVRDMMLKRAPVQLEQTSGEVIANERLKEFITKDGKDYSNYLEELSHIEVKQVLDIAKQLTFDNKFSK